MTKAIEIKMHFGGAISAVHAMQPELVADGTADLALTSGAAGCKLR
jgi:hypothetical protein